MKNQAFVVQDSSSPRNILRGLILDPAPAQVLTQFTASMSLASLRLKSPTKLFYLKDRRQEPSSPWPEQRNGPSSQDAPIHPTSVPLAEKGLDIYLIIGICGGGTVFLVFLALLVFYISKRKKQRSRRNGKLPLFCPTTGLGEIPVETTHGSGT